MNLSKTEVTGIALSAGFGLSIMHGQEPRKLMPLVDTETLLTFAKELIKADRAKSGKRLNTF